MFPGGKNMKDLMKQAQKMQQEMMKQQEDLESQVFTANQEPIHRLSPKQNLRILPSPLKLLDKSGKKISVSVGNDFHSKR